MSPRPAHINELELALASTALAKGGDRLRRKKKTLGLFGFLPY